MSDAQQDADQRWQEGEAQREFYALMIQIAETYDQQKCVSWSEDGNCRPHSIVSVHSKRPVPSQVKTEFESWLSGAEVVYSSTQDEEQVTIKWTAKLHES